MDIDREKLEDLESRLDAALAGLESARENKRRAELDLTTAVVSVHRASHLRTHLFDPPGRFRSGGAANFLVEFTRDPVAVTKLFQREAPTHALTALLEHHHECAAVLARAEARLEVAQRRVGGLAPVVSRCREFLRKVAA